MTATQATLSLIVALALSLCRPAHAADVQVLHAPTDVCSLVSAKTITAIFGSPGVTQTANAASSCVWTPSPGAASGLVAIVMSIEWPLYADHELLVLSGGMVMSIYVAASATNEADVEDAQYAAAVTVAKEALLNMP